MASLFDLFNNNNAQAAANAQIQGLQNAQTLGTGAINQGSADLSTYFGQALSPYTTNYGQAQQGTQALLNALGLGGASGNSSALTALQNTPDYQFTLDQGAQNVLRNSAATGTTASGATLNALQAQGQGTAQQTYNNYVSQLSPFLGASNTAASGIANVNTGLGTSLNANQGSIAQMLWNASTGAGNAQANADLANNNASANIFNALGSLAGGALNFAGTGGLSSLANFFNGGGGKGVDTLSDERLKENIKEVGELADGQPVYSYRYIWDDPAMTRIGLMAQDVEKINPDAVTEVAGFKAVDYGAATELAAALAKFGDDKRDNVVAFPTKSAEPKTELARYLEAA